MIHMNTKTELKSPRTPLAILAIGVLLVAGCTSANPILQAGSSTVLPIAEAWAEALSKEGLQVVVAGGGSGAGASKLCAGEISIADMSRELKASEISQCQSRGIEPLAWKIAYDGITVVVNKANTWATDITVAELKHIWRSSDPAQKWSDVRAGWPAEKIVLFGPDSDSGTYEYFNEEILGKTCGSDGKSACAPRNDFTSSADDNVLVEGVKQSRNALGHFGFAYYHENRDVIHAVPIRLDAQAPAVSPSFGAIADGSYKPLGRPLYMVTNGKPVTGSDLHRYFEYAMGPGQSLVRSVGFVELDQATLTAQKAWLQG
jgi:phosphate transport system substrate-binding protein